MAMLRLLRAPRARGSQPMPLLLRSSLPGTPSARQLPNRRLATVAPAALVASALQTTNQRQLKTPLSALHAPMKQVRYQHATASSAAGTGKEIRLGQDSQYEKLVPALRTFHRVHKHWTAPYDYQLLAADDPVADDLEEECGSEAEMSSDEVRGVKLDTLLLRFLKAATNEIDALESIVKELKDIGFPTHRCLKHGNEGLQRLRWEERMMLALRTFKEQNGNVLVEQPFVVPAGDDRWPRPVWSYKLGAGVNKLRADEGTLQNYEREDLHRIGFVWGVAEDRWNEYIMPALRQFKKLHGHCRVRTDFMVPTSEFQDLKKRWPEHLQGYRLGRIVSLIRGGGYALQATADADELEALGFVWNAVDDKWDNAILPALQQYCKMHGHSVVPRDFVVPSGSEDGWPEGARGLRLGIIVNTIRDGHFAPQVERSAAELAEIGFSFHVFDDQWFQQILPALQRFFQTHGHSYVPKNYVAPRAVQAWSPCAGRLRLGQLVSEIRSGNFASQVKKSGPELEAIEWAFNVWDAKWDRETLPALRHFFNLHGDTDVPKKFIVPANPAFGWPEKSRGLKLGVKVSAIHNGGWAYQVERSTRELKELRFPPFKVSEKVWQKKIMPALEAYVQQFGNGDPVPLEFVVPEEDPWPKQTWGFTLGNSMENIRHVTKPYEDHLKADEDKLRAMGAWWVFEHIPAADEVDKQG